MRCVEPVTAVDHPFLAALGAETRARLESASRVVSFSRGRVLFLEGDDPDAVYLVLSGLVRLFVTELDGAETTVRIAGAGELLGELAVIDGGTRSASAMALRPVTAWRVPAVLLVEHVPPPGTLGRALLRGLVATVRDNTRRLAMERTRPLERIVAALVLDDPQIFGRITQGELAELLGVRRQSLNLTLRTLERAGLIARDRGRPVPADVDGLRRLAAP